jgi:monothiol glutaredoxin
MLPDISGEEVEAYMLEQGIVTANDVKTDVPLNAPCTDAQHAAMAQAASQSIKMNL